jgi:hypothetical protein
MRLPVIVVVALLAVCAGDWVTWSVVSARMRDAYAQWAAAMGKQGWRVTSGPPVSAGFPFAAVLLLPDFALAGGDSAVPAGMDWSADQVDIALSLAHAWSLSITPVGRQALRVSRSPRVVFVADRIEARLPLGRLSATGSADMRMIAEGIAGGIAGSRHPRDVRVEHLGLHLHVTRAGNGRTDATLHLDGQAIALPDTGRWPLGATVSAVAADVALSSPALAPADPDDIGDADAESAATAWRDGGGTVTVRDFDLKWGPLTLALQADLRLDARLQPAGEGKIKAEGYDEALDALSRGGTIPAGVADTAKAVLGLLGGSPADRSQGLDLPFGLKDSTLSLGKIPVTKVMQVDWGRV